jgi:hypothetical protein
MCRERKMYTTSSDPYCSSNLLEYRQKESQSVPVLTTLYDVIEAVSEQVTSDEKYLVIPAVLKLLRDCRAGFLLNGSG